MARWIKIGIATLGGLVVGGGAAVALGTSLWNRATARAVGRLSALASDRDGAPLPVFTQQQLAGLPAPVARYFEFALTPGQPLVRRAHIRWAGEFFIRGAWNRFNAAQEYAVHPPGFAWDADIRLAQFLPVLVRDGYIGGEGVMRGKMAGLVSLVDQHGTPELAAGALVRYLAEAVWFPTALLSNGGVSWEAVDDSTARASLTDGPTMVSLDVHFGGQGEIVRVSTMRHRDVDGTPVLTLWVGHYRDYVRMTGMMVPTGGEVEWILPEGRQPYWRGRAVEMNYDFAADR